MKCYELIINSDYLKSYKVTNSSRNHFTDRVLFTWFDTPDPFVYREITMPREISCLALLLGISPVEPKTAPGAFLMYKEVG